MPDKSPENIAKLQAQKKAAQRAFDAELRLRRTIQRGSIGRSPIAGEGPTTYSKKVTIGMPDGRKAFLIDRVDIRGLSKDIFDHSDEDNQNG